MLFSFCNSDNSNTWETVDCTGSCVTHSVCKYQKMDHNSVFIQSSVHISICLLKIFLFHFKDWSFSGLTNSWIFLGWSFEVLSKNRYCEKVAEPSGCIGPLNRTCYCNEDLCNTESGAWGRELSYLVMEITIGFQIVLQCFVFWKINRHEFLKLPINWPSMPIEY